MQEAEDSLNLRLLGLPREYQASQRASLFYTLVGDSSGLWVGVRSDRRGVTTLMLC